MEVDKDVVSQSYAHNPGDELLHLHAIAPEDRPESLRAHWEGRASLASAYWGIGVLGGVVFALLLYFVNSDVIFALVFIALIPFSVFAVVSIWRCSWNTNWIGWGYIARTVIIVNGMRVVFAILRGIT